LSIIGDVKELLDLAKSGLTVELQHKLMESQRAELEFRAGNLSLKKEIRKLEERLSEPAQLNSDAISLLKESEEEGQDETRFCQYCYDDGEKLIRLQDKTMPLRGGGGYIVYECYKCKNVFQQ
jgi:hypothetical protein